MKLLNNIQTALIAHWGYLKYLMRHKWFVLIAGLETRTPLWRLIIHDWSKLLPSEWFAYVDYFYRPDRRNAATMDAFATYGIVEVAPFGVLVEDRFNVAWLHHQKRNKHHWQYWTWLNDDGGGVCMAAIPEKYIREMVADWAGAGRAIQGKWCVKEWFDKNRDIMKVRDEMFPFIESLVAKFDKW